MALAFAPAPANPIDPNPSVVSGAVDFAGLNSTNAVITQGTQQAIVDYSHFNIPEGSSVQFLQPNAQSSILNRIVGADPSFLNGTLTANGQVYFVNPAGVTFGPNSVVRADVFMAAAGQISNEDFLNGITRFSLEGEIINKGSIQAENGVGLFGKQVTNGGELVARNGYAIVAAGDEVHVRQGGTGLSVDVTDITRKQENRGTAVRNLGTVDGEEVMFSAGDAFATAIEQSGTVRARTKAGIYSDGGRVEVSGDITVRDESGQGGRIEVGGTDLGGDSAPTSSATTIAEGALLDASSESGDGGHIVVWSDGHTEFNGVADVRSATGAGGFIEGSGATIDFDNMLYSLLLGPDGHFLLDPEDIVIDGAMATSIETMLNDGTNVSVVTNSELAGDGDISVTASIQVPVNNSGNQGTLSLSAVRDITVDSGVVIQNLQEDFAPGETVFDFDAGRDIILNGDLRHSGTNGETGRGTIDLNAVGELLVNNVVLDANGGSVLIRADQVTLQGLSGSIISGLTSENTASVDITATSEINFAGGIIQTFGGSDVFIDTALLRNNTGPTAISRNELGESFFAIRLPNPTDNGSGTNHIYNGISSFSQATYNVADLSDQRTNGITNNAYFFEFQPTIGITANDGTKVYGDEFPLLTGAPAVTVNTSEFVTVPLGDPFLPDNTANSLDLTGVTTSSAGAAVTANVGTEGIVPTGAVSLNGYDIDYTNGSLTINPRAVTLAATQQEKQYGDILTLDDTAFTVLDLDGDAILPNGNVIDTVALNSVTSIDSSTTTNANPVAYADEIEITGQSGSGGFDPNNYTFTYVAGDLLVNPRNVTVTASQQEKFYGDILDLGSNASQTAFTVLDNGLTNGGDTALPNGETIDTVNLQSVLPVDVAASTTESVGTYTDELRITGVSGGSGFNVDNYNLTFVDGDLVVNPRPITLTPDDQARQYGDVLPLGTTAFTVLDNGLTEGGDALLPNGEQIDTVPLISAGGLAASTDADVSVYAGNIGIDQGSFGSANGSNGFNANNYDITLATGTLTIDPRQIELIASRQERFYGDTIALDDTAFTVVDQGNALDNALPNGETIDTVTISSATGIDASTAADAALYSNEIVIGSPVTGSAGTGDGFLESNYDITFTSGDLLINPRPITVTPSQQEKTYGDVLVLDNTAFTVTDLDGDAALPNGEVIDTVNVISRGGHDASTTSNAVTHTDDLEITSFGSGSNGFNPDNYVFDFSNLADFVINRRAATINALAQEKDYGDVLDLGNTAFAVVDRDGGALPNGENIDTVTLVSAAGIDASTDADAGVYADNITVVPTSTGTPTLTGSNGFNQENYDFSYGAADLTVNQRAITLTALEQDRIYGNTLTLNDTAFTILDRDGGATLPNGEVVTNVTINSATGVDASTTANVGTYTDEIVISGPVTGTPGTGDGFLESNYDITYVAGDLRVDQRAITVTPSQQEKTYGDVLVLDNTAFTVTDLDGDAALPNGEVIDTVNVISRGGHDASTTSNAVTHTDDLEITSFGSGSNGFNPDNYVFDFSNLADFVINRRAATINALAQEKDYGDVLDLGNTAFAVVDRDGGALPNGENIDTVTLVSAAGIDASTDADAGVYADNITVVPTSTGTPTLTGSNGFNQENYDFSYGAADLTVNQRAITLTALEQDRIYGNTLTLNDTAFTILDRDGGATLPNGEVVTNVTINSATGVDASTTANVGTYTDEIVISGPVTGTPGTGDGFLESNYDITYVAGDLRVDQRAITITALPQGRTYGESETPDRSAFVVLDLDGDEILPNGETIEAVTITSNVAGNSSAAAGSYVDDLAPTDIMASSNGFNESNYDVTRVNGEYTIDRRAISVTALDQSRIYGDPGTLDDTAFVVDDTFGGGGAALPNGETIDRVIFDPTSVPGDTTSAAGLYTDEVGIADQVGSNGFLATNYDISYFTGDYNIAQRAIQLVISDDIRFAAAKYDIDPTAFTTIDLDGDNLLPNGETVDTLGIVSVTGVAENSRGEIGVYPAELDADPNSAVGSNGFALGNYDITVVPGEFEIEAFPGLGATIQDTFLEQWIRDNVDYDPEDVFAKTYAISQSIGLRLIELPSWRSLSLEKRKEVLSRLDQVPLPLQTLGLVEAIIEKTK